MASKTAAFASVALVLAIIGISTWAVGRRQVAAKAVADVASIPVESGAGAEVLAEAPPRANPGKEVPVRPDDVLRMLAANDASATKLAEAGERKLRGRYESEQIDRNWAARKQQVLQERSVSGQIEQLDARPRSFDISCRTSICRIDAYFASATAANDWFTLFTLNAGGEMFNSSVRSLPGPDGSVHLEIYGSGRQ